MREIFSIRFFAAVGAVVGLFFLLSSVFAAREVIEGDGGSGEPAVEARRIDLVDQVFASSNATFRLDEEGLAAADTELVLAGARALRVVAGTPGDDLCPAFGQIGACAVVADLLGDAVVWFALVPMGDNRSVPMPAIDVLDDGYAFLVNGWEVPYAPILDRRCEDDRGDEVEFASYREFRDQLGDDFTSLYSIETRRLEAVVCRQRVSYAPTAPTTVPDDGDVPGF